jgi:acetyl esterase
MKLALTLLVLSSTGYAQPPAPSTPNVAYGPHERNVLDFWQAKSDTPTPLVVFIHGGGFRNGSKENYANSPLLQEALDHGVSCASISYRYLDHAPIQDIMRDCARAVQFMRSKASAWNLDKTKVAAVGGSAVAGTSLWLATRDDLADPKASDPVLHESSRVCCAVLMSTQATYDVTKWESFLGTAKPGFWKDSELGAFYRLASKEEFATEKGKAVLHECDMLAWISKDDAPIFMDSKQDVPQPTNRGEWLHCTTHARTVKKALDAVGVEAVVLQDLKRKEQPAAATWLMKHLKP